MLRAQGRPLFVLLLAVTIALPPLLVLVLRRWWRPQGRLWDRCPYQQQQSSQLLLLLLLLYLMGAASHLLAAAEVLLHHPGCCAGRPAQVACAQHSTACSLGRMGGLLLLQT